jgi:hypothetical protein
VVDNPYITPIIPYTSGDIPNILGGYNPFTKRMLLQVQTICQELARLSHEMKARKRVASSLKTDDGTIKKIGFGRFPLEKQWLAGKPTF